MKNKITKSALFVLAVMLFAFCPIAAFADGTEESIKMAGTFWALVPPIIAIGLALITKEVYSSLFIGVLVGSAFASNFHPIKTVDNVITAGISSAVADLAGIFVFLVVLGILVALMNKAGGSVAFGAWAKKNIKTRVGAILSARSFNIY